jgi:hypothetical protein
MPISKLEEDVLVKELGNLAGFFGGFGARVAARRLPVEEHQESVCLAVDVARARALGVRALQHLDGRLDFALASAEPEGGISAVVGSGNMNLNPTIVQMQFAEASPIATNVIIRALAKEGIVKQHSAEKAVERVKNLLLGENA